MWSSFSARLFSNHVTKRALKSHWGQRTRGQHSGVQRSRDLWRTHVCRVLQADLIESLEGRVVFNTTPFSLATGNFTQDWTNTGLITTNDNWANVPSIVGYRGDDLTTATGTDPQTLLAEAPGVTAPVVNVIANQTSTANTTGGVAEFELTNPVVAFQGSGTADAPNLVIYLDTTGRSNIAISYNLRDVDGTTDNAVQPVALQYRVGSTGNFINVPSGFVADASTGPSLATLVTNVSTVLPIGADNQPLVQVRIITANAVGNDEWIGVDDINISSSPFQAASSPNFTIATDSGSSLKAEGDSGVTNYSFTVTRDGNTTVAASVQWSVAGAIVAGTAAAASAADFTGPTSGTLNFAIGELTKQITVQVVGDATVELDEGFNVTLSTPLPTGATIGSGQGTAVAAIANDDTLQPLQAGDVVFTAISTAPVDVFAFVPLVDLLPGTVLYFTDNGWTAAGAAGALGTAEGIITYTVGASGLAKGTKVEVNLSADQLSATLLPASAGTATVSGSFALNASGDNLFAYAASHLIPRMLFALNTGATYSPATFSANTTFLPPALTVGVNAVDALATAPATSVAQSQYNHSVVTGSAATLLSAIANKANWVNDTSTTVRIPINSTNLNVGANIIVTPTTGLVTTEGGGTATFTVVLTTQPTATVSIGLSSSDTTEGTVAPTNLVFNSTNWNVPQTVTVTGVNDSIIDGNIPYLIVTAPAISSDPNYGGKNAADVSVTNIDNDTPGVIVTPTTGLITTEAGGTATFTVVLASQPTSNVTIGLASSNSAEGTVAPLSLVFTPVNWNTPQTATITGVDDTAIDGDVAYTIVTTATSLDANYNNFNVDDVSAINRDNDRNTSAVINEIMQNPAGTDNPFEYVELSGTPGSSLKDYYFVQFEGDGDSAAAPGVADFVVSLTGFSFGSNGLLIIQAPSGGFTPAAGTTIVADAGLGTTNGGMENGTVTSFLIYSPTTPLVETTDYDLGVGTLTLPSDAIIQDAVGWSDGGVNDIVYTSVVLTQTAGSIDAATRLRSNTTPLSVAAWFNGTILNTTGSTSLGYDPTRASANLPAGAVLTPGAPNFASNQTPIVNVNNANVTVVEGGTLTNSGTWSDADAADVVTLSASVGVIVKGANTWTWSLLTTDNVGSTTVTITANDGNGGVATTTFTYTVSNAAPAITRLQSNVTGNVLSTLTNSGTWSDVAADTVTLTASVGAVTKNANGTWSWSLTPSATIANQTVTITASDEDGGSQFVTFTISAVATVLDTKVYYKGSFYSAGGTNIAAALDTSKSLARSGAATQTLSAANIVNYSLGLNGLILDIAGLAATSLTVSDFTLRMSPQGAFNEAANPPAGWTSAPSPSAITVQPGSSSTAARVILEWPNNQIQNRWLQVRVLANANTGLSTAQTFYIGHLTGEVDGVLSSGRYNVQDADIAAALPLGRLGTASDIADVDRNGFVVNRDMILVRQSITAGLTLTNITIPVAGSGSEATLPPSVAFVLDEPGVPVVSPIVAASTTTSSTSSATSNTSSQLSSALVSTNAISSPLAVAPKDVGTAAATTSESVAASSAPMPSPDPALSGPSVLRKRSQIVDSFFADYGVQ